MVKTLTLPAFIETQDLGFLPIEVATRSDIQGNIALEKSRQRQDVGRIRQLRALLRSSTGTELHGSVTLGEIWGRSSGGAHDDE